MLLCKVLFQWKDFAEVFFFKRALQIQNPELASSPNCGGEKCGGKSQNLAVLVSCHCVMRYGLLFCKGQCCFSAPCVPLDWLRKYQK